MVLITAAHTDLSIVYKDSWSHNDGNMSSPTTNSATVSLIFNGTECSVYGLYKNDTSNLKVFVDNKTYNAIVQGSAEASDSPITKAEGLDSREHNMTLIFQGDGGFGINRFVWNDPRVTTGGLISGQPNTTQGQWNNVSVNSINFQQTSNQSASIIFTFNGTGIAVNGLVEQAAGPFSVNLDGTYYGDLNAAVDSGSAPETVLYRNLNLNPGNHTLILTNSEAKRLSVGQAQVFLPAPSSTSSTTETAGLPTASSTQSSTPSPSHRGLSKGGAAGVSIAVLASLGLVLFALWFWLRRRRALRNLHEKNQVSYVRVCSKCRQDITGDYRLECVDPNCPAAVDLHPECKDWNTQANHDHEVREVPNK
ncbi:transmembrane protein [Ceratobasidium sp. AG-Ba]|nr:transmembrane protein [Ceratobasidium sp. AG-Ba]